MVNLVDKQVIHRSFGKGSVVSHNGSYIKVCFESGEKKFVFPDAFGKYLKILDQKAADLISKKIAIKEKQRKEAELELLKKRALQLEQQKFLSGKKSTKNHENYSKSQSVFWCKAQEQDRIFTEWSVFTGVIKSGQKKGEPRRLIRMNQNSACLLTARDPNMSEKDRRILGVFMVDEGFVGKNCKDGYIPAHPEYRIRLSEEESKKMLFWNYYADEKYPHRIVWNSGRQRYFDNEWMAQILRDIVSLKEDPEEQEHVKKFFKYFCYINGINKDELPKPNGALMRVKKMDEELA